MHNFSQTAIKLLNDYKNILKKNLYSQEIDKKLAQAGLDKRLPRRDSELYRLLVKVIKKASLEENSTPSRLRYSGIDHFAQHMKSVLDNYRLENGRVIHAAQTASRAMIEAIQLIPLPEARLTESVAAKLDQCAQMIARYGVDEQKKIFMNSLKTHLPRQADFFTPLLNKFREYLAESICLEESEIYVDINKAATEESMENIAC
ncbi:MAG TPA: hypothetical protein VHE99_05455 [Gammaproteobacteria bacterium]|nr:hypothetical protein [Gammaproteobacteria bacterium]